MKKLLFVLVVLLTVAISFVFGEDLLSSDDLEKGIEDMINTEKFSLTLPYGNTGVSYELYVDGDRNKMAVVCNSGSDKLRVISDCDFSSVTLVMDSEKMVATGNTDSNVRNGFAVLVSKLFEGGVGALFGLCEISDGLPTKTGEKVIDGVKLKYITYPDLEEFGASVYFYFKGNQMVRVEAVMPSEIGVVSTTLVSSCPSDAFSYSPYYTTIPYGYYL